MKKRIKVSTELVERALGAVGRYGLEQALEEEVHQARRFLRGDIKTLPSDQVFGLIMAKNLEDEQGNPRFNNPRSVFLYAQRLNPADYLEEAG